jgi:hypothetical protein
MVVVVVFLCGCVTIKKTTIIAIAFVGGCVVKKAMIESHCLPSFFFTFDGFAAKKGTITSHCFSFH